MKKNAIFLSFIGFIGFILQIPLYGNAANLSWLAFGDLEESMAPCGCDPRTDLGGVKRIATLIHREKSLDSQVMVFDLGNNFLRKDQNPIKRQYLQKSLMSLEVDAALLNSEEFFLRSQLLKQRKFVLSHFKDKKSYQGNMLEYVQTPNALIFGFLEAKHSELQVLNSALWVSWNKIFSAHPGKTKILLFSGSLAALKSIAKSRRFDVIVSGHPQGQEVLDSEKENEEKLVYLSGYKPVVRMVPGGGRGVLRGGKLIWSQAQSLSEMFQDSKINQLKASSIQNELGLLKKANYVTWLSREYDEASPLEDLFKEYDKANALFFEKNEERKMKKQKNSPFVGAQACESCHKSAYDTWKNSKHAMAYQTLVSNQKHMESECVSCHVVAFDKGGFISEKTTPHLAGVQCENCHQARADHVKDPMRHHGPKVKSNCASCHHGSHSPEFDAKSYWEKIKHARH